MYQPSRNVHPPSPTPIFKLSGRPRTACRRTPSTPSSRHATGICGCAYFGGLARFDGVRFTIFNSANTPGLKSNRILALFEDRRGVLSAWFTETGELMSLEDGVGTTYPMTGALQGGIVWALADKGDRLLWAGTSKGLARLQDGKFTAYTTADGLPQNQIVLGEQDQAGRLWMMTERELVKFDGRQFVSYRFPEGLLASYFIRRRQGGFCGWPPRPASRSSSMASLCRIRICRARAWQDANPFGRP